MQLFFRARDSDSGMRFYRDKPLSPRTLAMREGSFTAAERGWTPGNPPRLEPGPGPAESDVALSAGGRGFGFGMAHYALIKVSFRLARVLAVIPVGELVRQRFHAVGGVAFGAESLTAVAGVAVRRLHPCVGAVAEAIRERMRTAVGQVIASVAFFA